MRKQIITIIEFLVVFTLLALGLTQNQLDDVPLMLSRMAM